MTLANFDPFAITQRRRFRVAVLRAAQAVQQVASTPGPAGRSAYQVAQDAGYQGTRDQWLQSLTGQAGAAGKTAYELAVAGGYPGTQAQWLQSLVGAQGAAGLAYLTTGTSMVGALVANVASSVTVQLQNPMRDATYNTRVIGMAAMVGVNVNFVTITRTTTTVTISCSAAVAVAASSIAVVAWQ